MGSNSVAIQMPWGKEGMRCKERRVHQMQTIQGSHCASMVKLLKTG